MNRLLLLLFFGVACGSAARAQWTGRRENLGPAVNDAAQQVLPVFSSSGDTLFFSETGADGLFEIRYSTRTPQSSWSPKRRPAFLLPSTRGDKYVYPTLPGGPYLVNGHFNYGLQSRLQGNGLAFAYAGKDGTQFRSLPFTGIDTMLNSRYTSACFVPRARLLLLSVRRAGNEDLFVCTALNPLEPDPGLLQWGAPQKLNINTPFAESAPWLAPDGTLYFASDRPGGLGGFDIWSAVRSGAGWTEWNLPKNLGAPVNSSGQERSFTIDPWTGEACFVSDSGTLGGSDIFHLRPDTTRKPPVVTPVPVPVADTADNDLREPRYKPNNIVFLLDLSNSMKIARRMALLKAAMRPLIRVLRPVDRVSLYRFGDHTERLYDAPALSDPKKLQHIVDSLRVQGEATNGSVAIKQGYAEALRKLLPAGNNQIFLVTDGDFPVFSDVERTILQTLNVQLTVVMIDESPEGQRLLAKFRRYPNVQIVTLTDVQKDAEALLRSVQGNARAR
ncbi:VWA domain-containing protein [Flaviaesturariibacter aridisoli]|uniref:VWA domain-containing protein n=1 Tax=Flaviaesturariibacter aridisoli TaxID=2545761 RepID=A0A4R4E2E7_9BACT|nr:VWA domain-containing protein [Flaviaesturariibacter aridisoli]TCZ73626.1 VWA domain-containing protein [Flaviaesturariibacter aridisoli]